MEGHVVTTNPWLVMAINMTVVFGVLILLGVIMHLIYLVDPTKKKVIPAATPAAPVVIAATAFNDEEVVAAIVGAIVSMGYSSEQIVSIRPSRTSNKWRLDGRLSGRN